MNTEVSTEEISNEVEVLVLSFSCEEKRYRNYKKDRVGFRGFRIRIWKETSEVYMGSVNTFGWVIPYRHRKKHIITYMSLLKGKLSDINLKFFDKLQK